MTSLIIPAYNEEHRIGKTIERYLGYFGRDTEMIIVLNGCVDGTESIVRRYAEKFPGRIRYTVLQAAGKGGAVREGFTHARGDRVGFIDADGSTSPAEFAKILKEMEGYDGAIGSRWMPGSTVHRRSALRMLVSRLFMFVERVLFGLPYRDTQCGAKVFSRGALLTVLPKLRVTNMAFDVELLWWLRRYGYRIKEVPTVWEDQSSSVILGSPLKLVMRALGMLWTLSLLRIRLLFSRHPYGSGTA